MTAWQSQQSQQPPVPPAALPYGIPPEVPAEPQRRRSAVGLWLQLVLQPLWMVPAFVPVFVGEETGMREGMLDRWSGSFLGPRRLRLERRGTTQEWERWLDERLVGLGGEQVRVERLRRNGTDLERMKYGRPREGGATIVVPRRYYRGIGPRGAAAVARRREWAVDWARSPRPYRSLTLRFQGPLGR